MDCLYDGNTATLRTPCKLESDSMLGCAEPNSTKYVIFGGKSIECERPGSAQPNSVQKENLISKFNDKHT